MTDWNCKCIWSITDLFYLHIYKTCNSLKEPKSVWKTCFWKSNWKRQIQQKKAITEIFACNSVHVQRHLLSRGDKSMGGKWNSSQIDVFACRENYMSHHVQKSYVTTNAIIIVVDISSALQCYSLRMRISSEWRVQVSQGESAFIRKRFPYPPPFCILSVQCVVFIPTRSIVFFAVYSLLYSLQCAVDWAVLKWLPCNSIAIDQCAALVVCCCCCIVCCYKNLSHKVGWELKQKSEIGSSGWFGWGGFFEAEWHQLVSTRSPEAPLNHHIQTSSLARLMESPKYNFSRGYHLVFGRFCAMWLWLEGLEPLSFWWHDRFNPRCAVAVLKSPLPCDG